MATASLLHRHYRGPGDPVGQSQHLDRLGQPRVALRRPVMVAGSADQIGQHSGISSIGFASRDGVALPIPAGRQRVDRHHLVASRNQCPDQQPRSVSIPTTTSAASQAWPAISSCSRATPATPSAIRSATSTWPSVAITHTSWWRSAQSIPTSNTASSRLLWTPGPGLEKGCGNLIEQCSSTGTSSHQPSVSSPGRRGHGLDERAQAGPTRSVWCSPTGWPQQASPIAGPLHGH